MYELLPNLPIPQNDGAANHLEGARIPAIELTTSSGRKFVLSEEFSSETVLFIFPRAGSPLEPNPNQKLWDQIPGARGCTPQSCGFRDLRGDFEKIGFKIFGLSVQKSKVLKEIAERNHLPFELVSDENHLLLNSMKLPEFIFSGERLIKRMAWVIRDAKIQRVYYPVFPSEKNAETVLKDLK